MRAFDIINVNVILPDRMLRDSKVTVADGKIQAVGGGGRSAEVIDGRGRYLSPGFVDMHVHGGGGADFMDNTVQAFNVAVNTHLMHGTTTLLPTTTACSYEEIIAVIKTYREAKRSGEMFGNAPGIHLEGPYLSPMQSGALSPENIRLPDPEEYLAVLEFADGDILRWDAAPELEGAKAFAAALKEHGVMASIAHSDAVYDEVLRAYDWGFRHITHLYSAMSTIKRNRGYRYAGVLESAYLIDDMDVEIIADGKHLPESLLKYAVKFKRLENISLVTDAMRAAGQPSAAKSYLGNGGNGCEVIIEDGVAKLPDRSAFAGSVATADTLVRNMVRLAGVPLTDAVRMMTVNPVRMLGRNLKTGRIEEGFDADLVLFDDDINVSAVFVKGEQHKPYENNEEVIS